MNKLINYMYMYMLISMIFMIIFMTFNAPILHPIFITIILILYTISSCLFMSYWSMSLLPIILFIIMISGMFIIFMYFSSTISNEQFTQPKFFKFFTSFFLILMLMKTLNLSYFNFNNFLPTKYENISNLYEYPFYSLSILCMIYLLFSMIIIIKICSINSKPLRKIK